MTNTNALDLFRNSIIGFDRFENDFLRGLKTTPISYPYHNIVKLSDGEYMLEMALAGFNRDDISIKVEDGDVLVIESKTQESGNVSDLAYDDGRNYIYRGIAKRSFVKRFKMGDGVKVNRAEFEDGMLKVRLEAVENTPSVQKIEIH